MVLWIKRFGLNVFEVIKGQASPSISSTDPTRPVGDKLWIIDELSVQVIFFHRRVSIALNRLRQGLNSGSPPNYMINRRVLSVG